MMSECWHVDNECLELRFTDKPLTHCSLFSAVFGVCFSYFAKLRLWVQWRDQTGSIFVVVWQLLFSFLWLQLLGNIPRLVKTLFFVNALLCSDFSLHSLVSDAPFSAGGVTMFVSWATLTKSMSLWFTKVGSFRSNGGGFTSQMSFVLLEFTAPILCFSFLVILFVKALRATNFAGEKLCIFHRLGVFGKEALSKWWEDTFRDAALQYMLRLLIRFISFCRVFIVNTFWLLRYSNLPDNALSSLAFCFFTSSQLLWFSWYFFA